jgi:hypothetical protein
MTELLQGFEACAWAAGTFLGAAILGLTLPELDKASG